MQIGKILIGGLLLLVGYQVYGQQSGVLSGLVIDKTSQLPVSGLSVKVVGTEKGAVTDSLGKFRISAIKTGSISVVFSALNYQELTKFNLLITSGNENNLLIEMEPAIKTLQSITVNSNNRRSAKAATLETPLSVQRLTVEEIKTNPGGNFDISRVIQALPGVGGTASSLGFRNDIIIRGGAPNENVYYLDGIEIPVINHFATQGSAGGPAGMLNVSFIEDVKLSSSAFDARYNNALSSVFEFKQKRGNSNHLQGNIRLSATELAATFDGPLSKNGKTTFLASARRSYLQVLFKAIDLPIRPNFWDFQYKISHQLNKKTTLTFLGVGAIDEFSFAAPKKATPEKLYALNSNPSIQQWNYTVGVGIKHLVNNGYWNLSISRNAFKNDIQKFENNLGPVFGARTLNYSSVEIENKVRWEMNKNQNGWKYTYGLLYEYVYYHNYTDQIIKLAVKDNAGNIVQPAISFQYNTQFYLGKLGAFIQAGKRFFNNQLGISGGIRTDMNTYTTDGFNPAKTLSPRISFSYVLSERWRLNASVGSYYKLAPYTILGFRDNSFNLVNKNADYLNSTHYVVGLEFLKTEATRFTFETFYKQYANVPISVKDGISLSNRGGDFSVLGNEAVRTDGKGRSFGFEFFAQQKLTKRFFGIFSYTYFNSEYTNADGKYIASSWDNRHLLAITMGYQLPHNWEIGLKFRYQGGVPTTPYDLLASRQNYLTLGTGVFDNKQLNTQRLEAFNSSDIRIDKKWNYKKATLDLYLDVTNWYAAKSPAAAFYTFQRNPTNTGFLTTDGLPIQQNGANALPYLLNNNQALVTPTIGFIVEF